MEYYAQLFGLRRGWLAVLVIVALCGSLGAMSLLRVDSDPRTLVTSASGAYDQLQQLESDFGASDGDCLILLQSESNIISPAGVQVVKQIVEEAAATSGVERVESMLDVRGSRRLGRFLLPVIPPSPDVNQEWFQRARIEARTHEVLNAGILSKDQKTTAVVIRLEDATEGNDEHVKQMVQKINAIAAKATSGTKIRAAQTGLPILRMQMLRSLMNDQLKFNLLGIFAASCVSLLVFRSAISTVVVMLSSMTGVVWTMGAMALLGVPVNFITSVIPPLVLVIGVADATHMLMEIRRAARTGLAPVEAAQAGIRGVGFPCMLTSLTTMVGFGSLYMASIEPVRQFGLIAALGCVLNYVAVLLVAPLLSATPLGKRLGGEALMLQSAAVWIAGVLEFFTHYRWAVTIAGVLLTFASGVLTLQLEAENSLAETMPAGQKAYRTLRICDRELGGVLPANVVVEAPAGVPLDSPQTMQVLREIHAVLREQKDFGQPLSILSTLESITGDNEAIDGAAMNGFPEEVRSRFVNDATHRLLVTSRFPDAGSRALAPQFDAVDAGLQQVMKRHPGFRATLTGGSVVAFRNLRSIVKDMWSSLLTASVVIVFALIIAFRSLPAGLISIVPNLLPLFCAGAAMVLSGRTLEVGSVVVFSICLGIATDDTIHFLARYRHERQAGLAPRPAVRQAMEVVGEALLVTTVLLTIGFASLALSEIPSLRSVGMLSSIALVTALLADLVLLPSLILCVYGSQGKTTPADQ